MAQRTQHVVDVASWNDDWEHGANSAACAALNELVLVEERERDLRTACTDTNQLSWDT